MGNRFKNTNIFTWFPVLLKILLQNCKNYTLIVIYIMSFKTQVLKGKKENPDYVVLVEIEMKNLYFLIIDCSLWKFHFSVLLHTWWSCITSEDNCVCSGQPASFPSYNLGWKNTVLLGAIVQPFVTLFTTPWAVSYQSKCLC